MTLTKLTKFSILGALILAPNYTPNRACVTTTGFVAICLGFISMQVLLQKASYEKYFPNNNIAYKYNDLRFRKKLEWDIMVKKYELIYNL